MNKLLKEEQERVLFASSITHKYLNEQLEYFEKLEKDFNKEIEDAKKLPNDPSLGQDVFSDGILNENPTIKSDILSGLYHQLGYATGSIVTIKETLKYLNMSKEDYAKHLKEQEEIVEHNKKELERVTKIIENGKKRFK